MNQMTPPRRPASLNGRKSPASSTASEASRLKVKSPHGVSFKRSESRIWSGVLVNAVEMNCKPGEAWHDITSPSTSITIVLDQEGGQCEPRMRLSDPCKSSVIGMSHASFVPAGMPLWGYTTGMRVARKLQLSFDAQALQEFLQDDLCVSALQRARLKFADDRMTALGRILAEECVTSDNHSALYGDSLALAMVIDVLRLARRAKQQEARTGLAPWQLRRVKEFMQAHLSDGVTLHDLASLTGLSLGHFSRAFKASTGLPPHRWLIRARIAMAQHLLLNSERTVSEIALSTGFSEQSHLTRVFSSILGMGPAAWRRSQRS
jgi:AraC-like DNA-binding protein